MKLGKIIFAGLIAYAVVKFTEHIAKEAAKTVLNESKKETELKKDGAAHKLVDRVIKPRASEFVKGVISDIFGLHPSRSNHPDYMYYSSQLFNRCPSCGHPLHYADRWCPNCGEKVPRKEV